MSYLSQPGKKVDLAGGIDDVQAFGPEAGFILEPRMTWSRIIIEHHIKGP
jgi:hypothetical protein